MTEETESIVFDELSFGVKGNIFLGPIEEIVAQRDKLFRELAIADKSSVSSKQTLLMQLLAIRALSTIAHSKEKMTINDLEKALFSFTAQFQVALCQLAKGNTSDLGVPFAATFLLGQWNLTMIEALKAGHQSFLNLQKNGEA
jgi:hypothetical protein